MKEQSFEQALEMSMQLYANQKYEHAEKLLLQVLEVRKDLQPALKQLGAVFIAQQRIGFAICVAERLITLNPRNTVYHLATINLYRRAIVTLNRDKVLPQIDPKAVETSKCTGRAADDSRVIILCGGEASRWNCYRGERNKQLVRVAGEILIQRTMRLLGKYQTSSIVVLVPDGEVAEYRKLLPDKVEIHVVEKPDSGYATPAWKYLSSESLWKKGQRNIVLLGDVWFSEYAMNAIFDEHNVDWISFGRHHPSEITGCPHGEIFGLKFTNVEKHSNGVKLLNQFYKAGLCNEKAAGWALLQVINNENPNIRSPGASFVNIDDFTEDFDFAEDYDRWVLNFQKAHNGIEIYYT